MNKDAATLGPREREARARRIIQLIDEIQEKLNAIRRIADQNIDLAGGSACNGRNGSAHA